MTCRTLRGHGTCPGVMGQWQNGRAFWYLKTGLTRSSRIHFPDFHNKRCIQFIIACHFLAVHLGPVNESLLCSIQGGSCLSGPRRIMGIYLAACKMLGFPIQGFFLWRSTPDVQNLQHHWTKSHGRMFQHTVHGKAEAEAVDSYPVGAKGNNSCL